MIAYIKGKVLAVDNKKFKGQEGDNVEYNVITIQSQDDEGNTDTDTINTKKDVKIFQGRVVVLKVNLKPDLNVPKLKVIQLLDVQEENV